LIFCREKIFFNFFKLQAKESKIRYGELERQRGLVFGLLNKKKIRGYNFLHFALRFISPWFFLCLSCSGLQQELIWGFFFIFCALPEAVSFTNLCLPQLQSAVFGGWSVKFTIRWESNAVNWTKMTLLAAWMNRLIVY